MFALPRAYPLTDARLSGLTHAEQLSRLAEGGATVVQLREKNTSPLDFYYAALEATELARTIGVRVIINDRVDIAMALGADGVHLGQDDMPPAEARRLLGPKAIIGLSTHSTDQVRQALSLPIDYLAIGPIFQTTSKSDTEPVLGLEGLASVRAVAGEIPLVAIGGISAANAREVLINGADSVAVISALLSEPATITQRTRALLESLSRH